MKVKYDCIECLTKQTITLAKKMTKDEVIQQNIISFGLKTLGEHSFKVAPPLITGLVYEYAQEQTGVMDAFEFEKREHNDIAKKMIESMNLIEKVNKSQAPFDTAVRLSISGNIIDFSVGYDIDAALVKRSVDLCLIADIHGEPIHTLQEAINKANKILILSDNAGEIVFDQLLINQMPREKCIYAVKGGPIVNDATMNDAVEVGMTDLLQVVETGSSIQGTILNQCSDEFQKIFEASDLIISKGQANYETLNHLSGKNIYFLLRAKCTCIADEIGCENNDFVIVKP